MKNLLINNSNLLKKLFPKNLSKYAHLPAYAAAHKGNIILELLLVYPLEF